MIKLTQAHGSVDMEELQGFRPVGLHGIVTARDVSTDMRWPVKAVPACRMAKGQHANRMECCHAKVD